MSTIDIADAIAARFIGLTATLDGTTEGLQSEPTARLPNEVTKGPVILVFPPEGSLERPDLRLRRDTLVFAVRLLRDPLNYPERIGWLYAWYDAMRDEVGKQVRLGLSNVWAMPAACRLEADGFTYGGRVLDVVELIVEVNVNGVITTLAS